MMKLYIYLALIFFSTSMMNSILALMLLLFFMSFYLKHDMELFVSYGSTSWDTLSWSLITLSIFIFMLMNLTNLPNKHLQYNLYYMFTMNLLLMNLIATFSVSNTLLFYIMFETSLIPIFILILGWGYQPERIQAGVYMILYTVFASLPLLFLLTLFSSYFSLFNMNLFKPLFINHNSTYLIMFFFLLAFLVKLPLYFVHMWLPKAHVEAPIAGSMVLAAILLKLGGYGIFRMLKLTQNIIYPVVYMFSVWTIAGGVVVSWLCLLQYDVKCLIALSSVAHMSIMMGGLLTLSNWGFNGAQFIMLGHGFCSSGLFCISNMMYERYNSRSLFLLKGMKSVLPTFTFWWFVLCVSNMASPPSLNLLGEMSIIMSSLNYSYSLTFLLTLLVLLSTSYSLYLYSQTQHSYFSALNNNNNKPSSLREHLILFMHSIPLNIMILSPWAIQILL